MDRESYHTPWYWLFGIFFMLIEVPILLKLTELVFVLFPYLTIPAKAQLFFLVLASLEGLTGFVVFHQPMKDDALSWNLVDEVRFCRMAGRESKMASTEEELPKDVVFNKQVAGNSSEAGLFLALMMLFAYVVLISYPAVEDSPRIDYILVMSLLFVPLILLPLATSVVGSQIHYGKYRVFWSLFWDHALSFMSFNSCVVGDLLYKIPTNLQHPYDPGEYVVSKESELELYQQILDRFAHNPFPLSLDDLELQEKLHAISMLGASLDSLEEHEELVDSLVAYCPSLRNTTDYFASHIDIWRDYKNGTIEKHSLVVHGFTIAAISPEAYIDLEASRDGTLDDNENALELSVSAFKQVKSLPGISLPNSIKYLAGYIALVFAVTPFAAILLAPLFG